MSDLTIGLLGALLATNQPVAISNVIQQQTGITVPVANQNDPEENELRAVMIQDDEAIAEVNAWITTNTIPRTNTLAQAAFQQRITERLNLVKQDYDHFLRQHPNNAHGYLAYGSFLNDIGDEDAAVTEYENSRQLDPKNPAVWNNLANYYGEHGPLTNAFVDYAEAIRLDPKEPVYYQNFATTVYLFRKDVKEFYHINEQQTFDKALGLYQQAMSLDPSNLVLATDFAESYYGIKPLRTNDALVAWTNALNICKDENEREGVQLHLARVKVAAGFYDEAQAHLDSVTNPEYADLKGRLERSLRDHKNPTANSADQIPTNHLITATNILSVPANQSPNILSPATNTVETTTNLPGLHPKVSKHQLPPPGGFHVVSQ